ncbi:MAG TPA: DNA translocase FtsK 4TM domain-containing protein [Bacteroidales bacterium]
MSKPKVTTKKGAADKKPSTFSKIKAFFRNERTAFAFGLAILLITFYLFIAFASFFITGAADQSKVENITLSELAMNRDDISNWAGVQGAFLAHLFLNEWVGISSFFILAFFLLFSLKLMKIQQTSLFKWFLLSSLGVLWTSIALSFFFEPFMGDSFLFLGGKLGSVISKIIRNYIGWSGTFLLVMGALAIFCIFTVQAATPALRRFFSFIPAVGNKLRTEAAAAAGTETERVSEEEEEIEEEETEEEAPKEEMFDEEEEMPAEEEAYDETMDNPFSESEDVEKKHTPLLEEDNFTIEVAPDEESYDGSALGKYDPTLDLSKYKYPTNDLLKKYDTTRLVDTEEQKGNKLRIIETLENYGIKISRIEATVGPTITLYEIVPAPGVRISKIKNLENDIALSLSALGIRIIAPIPGKGTIGIEVPNKEAQIVSMHSILFSKRFQESNYELPLALGKTITNDIFMVDLCKMPHILVAGATGQGKSVGLNAIITSLLYKKHPSQLKFVLIDPKKVEFNIYSAIERHFLAKLPDAEEAIVTDFTKVVQTLKSLTKEMDNRYDLLKKAKTRTIKEYNTKFIERKLNPEKGHLFMPYIVVIIDEFGDLIMTAGKDVEMPIARIAQLARAVGIHMVIATQRPSTNIITGSIKANFPARMAFRVASMIDSRTILDSPGANQLIGRGDFLFSQGSELTRVQCAFVDTPEVESVTDFIGNQTGYPSAMYLPECEPEDDSNTIRQSVLDDKDPLFEEAAHLLVIHQQGSTSLIQRKFSIGYNRAGRIVDQLEAAGIIGPFEGSKARQVLVQDEIQLERILENYR